MPLLNYKAAKKNIRDKMNLDHLMDHTSVFHDPVGGPKLDTVTVEYIKQQYRIWFNSWIADDIKLITQ